MAGYPSPVDTDDQDLLERIGQGDREAFAALYEGWAGRLVAFLTPALGATAASETAQEVLIRVWRFAHRYDRRRASPATWIFTIARNARTDRYRRMGRPEPDPTDPMWVPAPAPDPVSHSVATQRAERVRAALSEPPPKQREVMERAYLQGHSLSEIAAALEVPLGTVKSRSRLALQRLRAALADEQG